jgi:hypothetical protein
MAVCPVQNIPSHRAPKLEPRLVLQLKASRALVKFRLLRLGYNVRRVLPAWCSRCCSDSTSSDARSTKQGTSRLSLGLSAAL